MSRGGEGTEVELDIDGFTHGGEGVGRWDADGTGRAKAVFVPGVIPGERARVRITEDRKRFARAEALEVIDASPDRVAPPCVYVPACGGCDLQHVTPARQRALKTRVVGEQLERIGRIEDPPVLETLEVGPATGYRTTARLHAAADGRLGFHATGSHDVVAIDRCLVATDAVNDARAQVGDATGATEAMLRATPNGDVGVVLTPGPGGMSLPQGDHDHDLALAQPNGSVAHMRGNGELAQTIAGVTYRSDVTCFFQVNAGGAEALVREVLAEAGDVEDVDVWDLYAGVGLFSIPLARTGARVVAVENHKAAVTWAATNAEDASVEIATVRAPVERFIRSPRTRAEHPRPKVIVLDPPRTGAREGVVELLAGFAPARIVYVACDPAALARDAKVLTESGYRLTRVQPLDLFPMTHHVEAVATFVRR